MEPITHLTSGFLIYNLFSNKFDDEKKRFRNTIIISSIFPDIDAFTSFISYEFSLLYHRGITHSIVGAFLFAFLLTAIFFHQRKKFFHCYFISVIMLFIHIFLDLITSYGTQILLPFSNHRFSLNLVFIVDFLYTLPMLFFLILFYITKKRLFIILGIIYIFFYPLLNLTALIILKKKYYSAQFHKIYFVPVLWTPLNWRIIIDEGNYYRVNHISKIIKLNNSNETFQKANLNNIEIYNLAQQFNFLKTYLWFTSFPVYQKFEYENYNELVFKDLRFSIKGKIPKLVIRGKEAPFILRVILSKEGKIINWTFNK